MRTLTAGWILLSILFVAPIQAADWPQFRGPNRDDVSRERGLLQQWPEGGPPQKWLFREAGLGYSGVSVVGDTLYTMGARGTANGEQEFLIAVSVSTGKEKWATPIAPMLTNNWGNGPRGTPTVDGQQVYALSGRGTLVCARADSGDIVWKTTMQELGGKQPNWGYCESVLIDGDKLVCTPGGSQGAIVALDKNSGKPIWQSGEFTEGAQYASIIAVDRGGRRQYVQLTQQKLAGVDAESGKLLWTSDFPGRTAVIPTPIHHEGHIYVTAGYGAGCKLVKLEADGASDVYENKVMKNHHGGVVLIGKHVYGHSDGPGWTCQDFFSGESVWNERKLGKGSLTCADGKLYLFDERKGEVVLIDASPEGWNERGRFTLEPLSQQRSGRGGIWTHPVVANGKLFLRDQELLFCFDISSELAGGE